MPTHYPVSFDQARLLDARAVHGLPVALWLGGIACYHLLPRVLPGLGAALPTLALCLVLAWLTRPRGACSTRRSTH